MSNSEHQLREQLLDYAKRLNTSGLSVGKSGNISVRYQNGFLITPSAMDYQQLSSTDLVFVDDHVNAQHGMLTPSSEWHFHRGIYQNRPELQAVLHAHSNYCTALACTGRTIPSFHYMVAIAGGADIPLAPYALYGTERLSIEVVNTLQNRLACLLANHGMIAVGTSLERAFNLALAVENLAQQYCIALQLGDVKLLTDQQMLDALEKFQSYGQRL